VTGVGIDLLEIDRMERALARRPRLAQRLFTAAEREHAGGAANRLAARFCAKEAVAKALQLRDGSWLDVEVVGGGDEPPAVLLSGAAERRARELGVTIAVSLTHTDGMAAAVAVTE
jgi:holo-[acyl-carrier protein] synthase